MNVSHRKAALGDVAEDRRKWDVDDRAKGVSLWAGQDQWSHWAREGSQWQYE